MTASAILGVVGAWILVASALALVIGRLIARADQDSVRRAGVSLRTPYPDVTVPAPRDDEIPALPEQAHVGAAGAEV